MTRVLIVDDHELFRAGLEALLTQLMPQDTDIWQAPTVKSALQLSAEQGFDIVLLDWHMPELSGLAALHALHEALPLARIVVLSGEQNPQLIRACIDEGAAGFIPKDSSSQSLSHALRIVTTGGVTLPPLAQLAMGQRLAEAQTCSVLEVSYCFPQLTPRQCDVLRAMAKGLSNKLIARELSISDETVKQHLAAVYHILGVRNRTEAVYAISQRGLRVA